MKRNSIIDTIDELEKHTPEFQYIMIPVYEDNRIHPADQKVSALYMSDCLHWDTMIIPINHSEKVGKISLNEVLGLMKEKDLYVWDKKSFLNHIEDSENIHDIQLSMYYTNESIEEPNLFRYFYNKFNGFSKINTLIPLAKLYNEIDNWVVEQDLYSKLKANYKIFENTYYKSYESTLKTLQQIEKNGIFHSERGIQYTQYNIYTTTGRPSNRFGGVNYAALNKSDDTRESYTSRFNDGFLYLYDYQAFHPTIISNYLKIERPASISIHTWLGNQYFNKQELTQEEYDESKRLTFYYLYGNMSDVLHIPFFSKVKEFVDSIEESGEIRTPIFKRVIKSDGMSKEKIFNYFLQALETEINFVKMKQLNRLLANKHSKLVLYTYDSFLIDYSPQDSESIITEIKKVLEYGNFNVTISKGKNYKNLSYIS